MGYKIKVYCVGRRHPEHLKEAIAFYEKRLKSHLSFEWVVLKSDKELIEKVKTIPYYCFDVLGKELSSEAFSAMIEQKVSWNFVIGGAEGLPLEVKNGATGLISFSKFTFPHELVRLFVLEQVYRAFEIIKKTPYHKGASE